MRRWTIISALAVLALAMSASTALGSWSATGSGNGYSRANAMPGGNTPTTSVSGRNVTVNWTASSGNVPVDGYKVKRYSTGGAQQTIGSGCSGTIGTTSCTEAAVPPGSWKYSVTPVHQGWSGSESAQSSTATVGSPNFTLSTSTITCRPGTLSGNLTNFIAGDSVTFHLDSPTGTTLSGSTTPSTMPSNGQATASVSIPTSVAAGSHTVYAVDSGDTASSPSASFTVDGLRVATGSYVGNSTTGRQITGAGFQPDAVIIKASTAQVGVMSTTAMGTNNTKPLTGASAPATGLITSLGAPTNGFTVGNDSRVNGANTITYYWTAFQWIGDPGVGSYTGDGSSGHAIGGLGFSPDYAMILGGTAQPAVERMSAMTSSFPFDKTGNPTVPGKGSATAISSLDSAGFTVGNNAATNSSGSTYYYATFNQCAGSSVSDSYTGNGATQQVSGIGFQPSYVTIRANDTGTARDGVQRNAALPGAESQLFSATADNTTNITSLSAPANGFTVGNNAATGASGVAYDYVAFTDAP